MVITVYDRISRDYNTYEAAGVRLWRIEIIREAMVQLIVRPLLRAHRLVRWTERYTCIAAISGGAGVIEAMAMNWQHATSNRAGIH